MNTPSRFLAVVVLLTLTWLAIPTASAVDPLGLTPGVQKSVILGSLSNAASFDTTKGSADINYSFCLGKLSTATYWVRLPSGYDPSNPARKYALLTWIDSTDVGNASCTASITAALDAHDVIWIGGNGIGNSHSDNFRRGTSITGAFRMMELYNIDPNRIYAGGRSGGGRMTGGLAYLRSDFFAGFIGRVGGAIPATIPGWQTLDNGNGVYDDDYENNYVLSTTPTPSVVLPSNFRTSIISWHEDYRRSELAAIYRYGMLNYGNNARFVIRPGEHTTDMGESFTDALNFMYHPLANVIWDRFEDGNLATNVEAGKTVAGSGFTALSGTVSEGTYTYNANNLGILRLNGNGAAVEANNRFAWKDVYGIQLDARLRAETAAGQNQKIGLHLVPETATGTIPNRTGIHLYWSYGEPYRLEVTGADGVKKTLATWDHTSTHPMNLPTTLTSPQAGEGIVQEKTFWGDTAAPDYAGRTLKFRGEDVRMVLNSTGLQLTFNRVLTNLNTYYSGAAAAPTDSLTVAPTESFPIVLTADWANVDPALAANLPGGKWKLVLTNDAVIPGQTAGNAVVDEIRLVGFSGTPSTYSATRASASQVNHAWTDDGIGGTGYRLQRADSPNGPFTTLATLISSARTYSDLTAAEARPYYYKLSALDAGGQPDAATEVVCVPQMGAPAPPTAATGFTGTFISANQANLTWVDSATDETAWRIERAPGGSRQWTLLNGSLPPGTTAYNDTTAAAATVYDYRVSAVGPGGLSTYAIWSGTSPAPVVPLPSEIHTSGSSSNMSLGTAWVGGVAPGSNNIADFANIGTFIAPANSSFNWYGIKVTATVGTLEINPSSGGNTYTINLGAGGIYGLSNIDRLGPGLTVNVGTTNQTWNVDLPNVSAAIAGSSTITFPKTAWLRSGSSTFTGVWRVPGGTIYTASNQSMSGPTGATVQLLNDGTLQLDPNTYDRIRLELVGDGNLLGGGAACNFTRGSGTDTGNIYGPGNLTLTGSVSLNGDVRHTGNTFVDGGITFTLGTPGVMTYTIGANGVNNALLPGATGVRAVTLNGSFAFDLTGANTTNGNSWTVVDVANLSVTYGATFGVAGFTKNAGIWTKVSGLNVWTYSQTTGVLSLAIPYKTWASAKGLTAGVNDSLTANPDGDGMNNLAEFAFDGNPLNANDAKKLIRKIATVGAAQAFTFTLPVRTGAVFSGATEQVSAAIDGLTYRIQGSYDLAAWNLAITEVTGSDATAIQSGLPVLSSGWSYRTFRTPGSVTSGAPKAFMRSVVQSQ